jgi:hypothetical protein
MKLARSIRVFGIQIHWFCNGILATMRTHGGSHFICGERVTGGILYGSHLYALILSMAVLCLIFAPKIVLQDAYSRASPEEQRRMILGAVWESQPKRAAAQAPATTVTRTSGSIQFRRNGGEWRSKGRKTSGMIRGTGCDFISTDGSLEVAVYQYCQITFLLVLHGVSLA